MFDGPLIVNQSFTQTEFVFGKSNFTQIMYLYYPMLVQYHISIPPENVRKPFSGGIEI